MFVDVIRQPVEERSLYLDNACGGNKRLRSEVESLLSSFDSAESFLESPACADFADIVESQSEQLGSGESFGHFTIIRHIGSGGMGEVYLAEDTLLKRNVALKLMPKRLLGNKEQLCRFEQEAQAASSLNHPNVLTVYEIGVQGDIHFIATEYIEGESLRERMRRSPFELDELLDIAIQIASALAAAHEKGIVHRDIKPENIMIREDGLVKVLDFGLAKLLDKSSQKKVFEMAPTRALVTTASGIILGTPGYMSPEQARGNKTDARTDIWSLGCVLFEMLTGKMPFEGETPSDTVAAILTSELFPLTQYAGEIPSALERSIEKALRKDLKDRYQQIKDLLRELEAIKEELEFTTKLEHSLVPTKEESDLRNKNTLDLLGQDRHRRATVRFYPKDPPKIRSAALAIGLILLSVVTASSILYFLNPAADSTPITSIAVLPFQNATGNSGMEYISDGISESLINSLTQLQQLRVIARSTAFQYKDREIDPVAAGRELKVRSVLTGRVRQAGETLNIQVDLVDTANGAQIWGAEYEHPVADLLFIKQAIAREVAGKLRLELSEEQQRRLLKRDTTSAEAYRFYLRGRYLWTKRTADSIRKAIEQFEKAIERDPNFALGFVGLADSYVLLEQNTGTPASETLPIARRYVDRALQLDDSLAEAHASSAFIYVNMWRWAEAHAEFKQSLSLNPNYVLARHWFAIYFRIRGQLDDALREATLAHELAPLEPAIGANLGVVYLLKNDFASAREQSETLIQLFPEASAGYWILAWTHFRQGQYDSATDAFRTAAEVSNRQSFHIGQLGYCYAVTGRRAEAFEILKELERKYADRESVGLYLASVYAGLGDKDQAFAWLERDFEERSGQLAFITWWFALEDLRTDPRYADLVRRIGLEP